jgi:ascorbate PTS system EIIB component
MTRKRPLRIVTVCGMGFGTSLMLKMAIDDLLHKHGLKAEVLAWDLGSLKGQPADIIVAPLDMERHLKDVDAQVVYVRSLTDRDELEAKLLPILSAGMEPT